MRGALARVVSSIPTHMGTQIGCGGDKSHSCHKEAQAGKKTRFGRVGEELSFLDITFDVLFVFLAQVADGINRSGHEEYAGKKEEEYPQRVRLKYAAQCGRLLARVHKAESLNGKDEMRQSRDRKKGAARPCAGDEHEQTGDQRDEEKQSKRHD